MDASRLQFEEKAGGQVTDVVIGFDFGTASTKVVVRFPFLDGEPGVGRAYAVPFAAAGHPGNPFLLPTGIRFDDEGQAELAPASTPGWLSNLKGRVVQELRDLSAETADVKASLLGRLEQPCGRDTRDPFGEAVAFVALALRGAREWVLSDPNLRAAYSRYQLRWSLHFGAPTGYAREPALDWALEAIGHAGWLASLRSLVKRGGARGQLRDVVKALGPPPARELPRDLNDFLVVPEVVAEAIGYARTPELRRPGLHFLVDAGAGTLDVSGFMLVLGDGAEVDVEQFHILEARVDLRGTSVLQDARFMAIQNAAAGLDRLATVPGDFLTWAATQPPLVVSVTDAETAFISKSAGVIVDVVMKVKKSRDPNNPAWRDEVSVFFCGGGSRVDQFKRAVQRAGERLATAGTWNRFVVRDLGRPNQAHLVAPAMADGDFHRLAVAWGLSFLDLGDVRRPDEIEDITPHVTNRPPAHFVDKDNM
jgi:hypothetical protein